MADGIELAKAYVQIIPSAEGISGSISQAVAPEASSAGDEAGEKLGNNLVSKLKGILVAGGIAAAVKGIVNSVNEVASAGDNIDKMSQKMGIAADQFQALSFMGEHCAISMGTFQKANVTIQKSGFNGTLVDFLDKLQGIEDVSKRTAYAQEILGEKTANEMAAFINGSDTMSDYYNQLESLGGMMSNDAVKASATYEDSLTNMNVAMGSIKTRIMSELLPGFSQVMDGVAQLFSGDGKGFTTISDGITGMFTMIYEKGKELLTNFITGYFSNLPELISTNGEIFTNLLDNILDKLPEFMSKGGDMLSSLIKGIVNNIPKIVASIATVIANILKTIISHLPQILQSGFELLGKLASGIISAIPKLVSMLPQVFNAIKNAFKGVDWLQLGKDIINGIIKGIKNMMGSLGSALSGVASSALGGLKKFLGIHSPSTVFRDQIGKFIPEGMAVGIEANTDSVTDAIHDMTNEALGTANMALSSDVTPIGLSGDSQIGTMINLLQQLVDKENSYSFNVNGKTMAYAIAGDMDNALAYLSRKNGGRV